MSDAHAAPVTDGATGAGATGVTGAVDGEGAEAVPPPRALFTEQLKVYACDVERPRRCWVRGVAAVAAKLALPGRAPPARPRETLQDRQRETKKDKQTNLHPPSEMASDFV